MTARYDAERFLEPVKQILDRVMGEGRLAKKRRTAEVWAAWPEAVGTRIAAHARPLRLERGILTVRVDSSAWHHQLLLREAQILAALEARVAGPRIKKLRFDVGNL